MNRLMNQIYAGYEESELELLADFLHRTATPDEAQPTSCPTADNGVSAIRHEPGPANHPRTTLVG
jgi:hypothetical protein